MTIDLVISFNRSPIYQLDDGKGDLSFIYLSQILADVNDRVPQKLIYTFWMP